MSTDAAESSGAPSLSSLPPIPPDPREIGYGHNYPHHRSALLALNISQQLILLQICILHKQLYKEPRGNSDYWQRVTSHFWGISGWHWIRVRTSMQDRIRRFRADPSKIPDNPEGQVSQLLTELIAHIDLVNDPIRSRIADAASMSWWVPYSQRPITNHPRQGAVKRTALQAGFDDEIDSDDDLPGLPDSRAISISSDSSSASIGSQSLPTEYSEQELIAKSKEAKERCQFDKAKSLLLRIPDKTIYEPLLDELDTSRELQIKNNMELEHKALLAQSRDDWELAKLLLSRVVSPDARFLLLGLEYGRTRLQGHIIEAYDLIDQLEKEYPDPRLKQVSFELDIEEAKLRGRDDKRDHYRGLLSASRKKIGSLWSHPEDFRNVFRMMAADMRNARDKAWYAHPARAKKTALQSDSDSDSGPVPVPQSEPQTQSQSRHEHGGQQPDTAAELRPSQGMQPQAQAQAQPRAQPRISSREVKLRREIELRKVERAWKELHFGQNQAIAALGSASSDEAKRMLATLQSEKSKTLDLLNNVRSRINALSTRLDL